MKTKISLIFESFVIALVVLISIVVRLPYLNKNLDYNNYVLAHSLITLNIWQESGPDIYNFSPIYTFTNPGDKNIASLGGIADKNGNFYYISYPPFTFILPYITFRILGLLPTEGNLRMFGITLHAASLILLYILLRKVFYKRDNKTSYLILISGTIIYAFSSGNLWFTMNNYFADIAVQPFFILGIYQVMFSKKFKTFTLGIVCFFMIYTEWIGLLFVISLIILNLTILKGILKKNNIIGMLLFSILAILLTLFQYSSITGFYALITALSGKFLSRSLNATDLGRFSNIGYFIYHYYFSIVIIVLLSFLIFYFKNRRRILRLNKQEKILISLILIPITLHYLLFWNYNINHSFSTYKLSLAFVVMATIIYVKIVRIYKHSEFWVLLILIFFITSSLLHIYTKYPINENDKFYLNSGVFLASGSESNKKIFLCNYPHMYVEPQILYYARRNIQSCMDKSGGINTLKKNRDDLYTIFTYNNGVIN